MIRCGRRSALGSLFGQNPSSREAEEQTGRVTGIQNWIHPVPRCRVRGRKSSGFRPALSGPRKTTGWKGAGCRELRYRAPRPGGGWGGGSDSESRSINARQSEIMDDPRPPRRLPGSAARVINDPSCLDDAYRLYNCPRVPPRRRSVVYATSLRGEPVSDLILETEDRGSRIRTRPIRVKSESRSKSIDSSRILVTNPRSSISIA